MFVGGPDASQNGFGDSSPQNFVLKSAIAHLTSFCLLYTSHRYLALDLKSRLVYEIDPKLLTPHGADFESDEPEAIGRLIPTLEWNDRDVGPAERIQIRLGDYGKMLEVELPHPIDLRRGIY